MDAKAFMSPYILAIAIAWPTAHLIKFIINTVNKERYSFRAHLFMSGGMPSSHTATTVALATVIGMKDGFDSGLFVLALLFSCIVMCDAVKVRRSVGEQGLAIRHIIKETESKAEPPRSAKGHTPWEVVAGCVLGLAIGVVVFLSTI